MALYGLRLLRADLFNAPNAPNYKIRLGQTARQIIGHVSGARVSFVNSNCRSSPGPSDLCERGLALARRERRRIKP